MGYFIKKICYSSLVLLGVVSLVFFMFQGFGDPARMIVGQTGDKKTMDNIRSDLYLDQPKWKQFLLYLNDVSPLSVHSQADIEKKQLKGLFIGGKTKFGIKIPYLRKSYQTKKDVGELLMEALPGTLILAVAAMLFATVTGILLGVLAAVKKGTRWDTAAVFSSITGISAPYFPPANPELVLDTALMSAEECAHIILKAVINNDEEILVGGRELKAVTLRRFFPKLFGKIIRKQSPF